MATRSPARWYLETGRAQARERGLQDEARSEFLRRARELRRETLTAKLKEIRAVFSGFDAASGYNLHNIKSWPAERAKQVEKYGEYLRHLKSQPHSILRPRNKKQKRALQTLTGQDRLRRQKAYVVHKSTDADIVKMTKDGMISVERKLPEEKGFLKSDFYLFRAYLRYQPKTWDEVYAATIEIMKYMPDGRYFIYSELHGEIDTPHEKRMLPRLIMRYGQEYDQKNFAETIIGFKRISDQITPNAEYQRIFDRRNKERDRRKKASEALRAQVRRRIHKENIAYFTSKKRYYDPSK